MTLLEGLARELTELRASLSSEGKLIPEAKLTHYTETFRNRFGPETLARLDGLALLEAMHLHGDQDSLVYWLEFKNDEELETVRLGSIAGGSAHKFGVYWSKERQQWVTGSPQHPKEVSVDEAIQVARRHREQLTRGTALIERLSDTSSDAQYRELQEAMDELAPDVSNSAWGHKYFSLLYPDKLDDYHVETFQRYQLIRCLQVPPPEAGRYVCGGRFISLARDLGMPINHLSATLNHRNGTPRRYWRIGTRSGTTGQSQWALMQSRKYVSIGWADSGELSDIRLDQESKSRLRQRIQESYSSTPQEIGRITQQVFNFVAGIAEGDIVLPSDGAKVLGIGRVTGEYQYDGSVVFPHLRPVEWLDLGEWSLPTTEGLQSTVRELHRVPANLVEIERRILGQTKTPDPPKPSPKQLDGLAGRIQAVLERKGQIILYGPPGTGKTYWARRVADALAAMHGVAANAVRICTFHPGYGYEDFLEGYRPVIKDNTMAFELRDGIFKRLCRDAEAAPDQRFYLIIDEINRGDIPRIFGELLTLLEKDKRGLSLMFGLSGQSFRVPANVFVIGTMNTADRSIALLDAALRRRFGFIELMPDSTVFGNASIESIALGPWLDALNARVREHAGREARNLQIGHSYLLNNGLPISQLSRFVQVLRDDIIPLLEEYTYEDYSALEKILGSGIVDLENQRIREDVFGPAQMSELVQMLISLSPEIATSHQAVAADANEQELTAEGDDDEEETASGAEAQPGAAS